MTPEPQKWTVAHLAWIGGGVVVLIMAMGFVDFIGQSSACAKDPCWPLWLHCMWTTINSPVVIGLATLFAAVLGLNAWRQQFQGTNDYRVAVETMKGVYAVKQALRYVRRPLVMAVEMAGRSRREGESPAEADARDVAYAYYQRLTELSAAESKLRVAHLEAIAHWGEDVANPPLEPVWKLLLEMNTAYHQYFQRDIEAAIHGGDRRETFQQSLHRILFATPGEDKIADQMEAAVKAVDEWLRPHIRGR